MIRAVRALIAYPLAILAGFLPRRYWEEIDLPIANVAFASAILTFFAGTTLGIIGYFAFLEYVAQATAVDGAADDDHGLHLVRVPDAARIVLDVPGGQRRDSLHVVAYR